MLQSQRKVYVKLIATYRDTFRSTEGNIATVDVPTGATIAEVLAPFGIPLDERSGSCSTV
jgi:hypothetical protein